MPLWGARRASGTAGIIGRQPYAPVGRHHARQYDGSKRAFVRQQGRFFRIGETAERLRVEEDFGRNGRRVDPVLFLIFLQAVERFSAGSQARKRPRLSRHASASFLITAFVQYS